MSELVRYRTREMQRVEAQEGRPLDVILRELYIDQGLMLVQVGERLGIGESAAARWLQHFDIPARKGGPVRDAAPV